jgi:hypothetical protein
VLTQRDSVESGRQASYALSKIGIVATSQQKQEQDLQAELKTATKQVSILQAQATSAQMTAQEERAAAKAATLAANAEVSSLKLQQRQLILSFQPVLILKPIAQLESIDGFNDIHYTIQITNKGNLTVSDFGIQTGPIDPDAWAREFPLNTKENELQESMCKESELNIKSNYHIKTSVAPSETVEVFFATSANDLPGVTKDKSGTIEGTFIIQGCLAYHSLQEGVLHHVRFRYVGSIDPDPFKKTEDKIQFRTPAGGNFEN